ncbi:MAG TPA: aldehyde dehydrogenase [Trebonia sp.]|nr:aldehyde dehydrogenase [Trebonia sp.]
MTTTSEQVLESLYIGGTWRRPTGDVSEVLDPSDEHVLGRVASATEAEVHAALAAARDAQPAWARVPAPERGRYLRAMAALILANAGRLAALIVAEVGKPAAQAADEVNFAAGFLSYNAEWDRRLEGEILPGDVAGETIHLSHGPVGVVAAICPWNFPLAVLCRKLGPALVTGNAVVVKPSEESPLATIELFRLFDAGIGLPPGVLNLVTGAGPTGHALVASPATSMVSFTGHRDTGKAIMAAAAGNLTRVALELGGKAPAIVWRDADLGVAVPAIAAARHANSGQVCTSAERVFVHADVHEAFLSAYVAAVEALTLGAPAGPVDMGPLVSRKQLAKVEAAVATARDEGARVITGGGAPAGDFARRGYWYAPTVLGGVRPDMTIMREETFGPVTPVYPVHDLGEAIALSNDSRYGLSAYIFSRDYQAVMRTAEELQFGEIYINRTLGESIHAHHAGYRESGIGGEDGKWGLLRYTQVKTAYHHWG